MTTFAPQAKLFANPDNLTIDYITRSSTTPLTVGTLGPLGLGECAAVRPSKSQAPTRYSNVAIYMHMIFTGKAVFRSSADDIYGEAIIDEKLYRFTCDGKTASYEKDTPSDNYALLPFFMYHMRNESEAEYLKTSFAKAKEQFLEDEACKPVYVLQVCDGFAWGPFKKGSESVTVDDNDLVMETVQQAVRSGLLVEDHLFKGLKPMKMTGIKIDNIKVKPKYTDLTFDEIKSGVAKVSYNWTPEQEARIPDMSSLEQYIPCKTFFSAVGKVKTKAEKILERMANGATGATAIGNDAVNVFITGKPGTGKTTLAYALGAATGMPVYTIAMTKNTEEDVFQGMNKVVDGQLQFVSTDFLEAYTHGGIVILEEINLPDPSVVMGAIGQAVEFPYSLMKDGYIPVKRHPLCVIIGTMNIGTYGSKGVNQALSSRFRQSYVLDDPTKENFLDILAKSGATKKASAWVYDAYSNIVNYLKSPKVNAEDVCLNVTLRGCIGALENIEEGEEAKEAIRNTLVGKIAEVDLALAEEVMSSVVEPMRDLY